MLDVYSFMRSSVAGLPVMDLSGGFHLDENQMIRAWMDIKLTPLLSSISRNFLMCLGNRNFSCSDYQSIVQEISQHFSSLDPERQRWIYSFFMYPFLSRNSSSGCVDPQDSTEDWLLKNFGSFSILAQVKEFTAINLLFSGLEVLHLLTPEQKAELLLHPEVTGLTNSSLQLVFESLASSLMPSESPGSNGTMIYIPASNPQDPLGQAVNSFLTAFRPVGSFVHQFVSLTNQPNLNSLRSATLVQAMLNLTLAEMAAPFKQQVEPVASDPTNVTVWFKHVASPILRRFLPQTQIELQPNLTATFHNQFYIETGMGAGQNETQDICSVFIDDRTCGLTDLVEHVAMVLQCSARSNLTLNENTVLDVLSLLSKNLGSLLQQLSMSNFSSQSSPFTDILNQINGDTFPKRNLEDESFVELWFQVKLKPLLSTLTPEFLMCLSHKEFSCRSFQTLVSALSENIFLLPEERLQNVYQLFIFSFLSRHNVSGGCPAQSSSAWVSLNLGGFSRFATLREMYHLNQNFSAMEALAVLSPRQTAELIVEEFAGLPQKNVVIDLVFDYILVSPEDRGLLQMLGYLVLLANENGLECSVHHQLVERVLHSVVPANMTEALRNIVNRLQIMEPPGCFPSLNTCLSTPVNKSAVCSGINSSDLLVLSPGQMSAPCSVNLQQLACSSLPGLSAGNLAELLLCQLSSNNTYSKEIWKLLLSQQSAFLDGALSIFSGAILSQQISREFASQLLDVIAELRLEHFSSEQWRNLSFIGTWFGHNLKPFLPFASLSFLQCTSSKNLSCQTFQQILPKFPLVDMVQGSNMAQFFILPYLQTNGSDAGCVSSTNSSVEWLRKNFASFTQFASLRDLLTVNPHFKPLETLSSFSPVQTVELMVGDLPGLPGRDLIISRVFDYLIEAPEDRRFPQVLHELYNFTLKEPLSCPQNQLIFTRLDRFLRSGAADLEPVVWKSLRDLSSRVPAGCTVLPVVNECPVTPYNEALCNGVNSSALDTYSRNGNTSDGLCDFWPEQIACAAELTLSHDQLVSVLSCSSGSSPGSWKLLLTKVSNLLDAALYTLTSRVQWWGNGSSSAVVLDVLRELRLDRLSEGSTVAEWFESRLRPFLPFATKSFLQCVREKNFSCQSLQRATEAFDAGFLHMTDLQRQLTVSEFIVPILSRLGAECASADSSQWLLGFFAQFSFGVSISQMMMLNTLFNPLAVLPALSPKQLVELVLDDIPNLPEKTVVVSAVFDHLSASGQRRRITEALALIVHASSAINVSCSTYQIILHHLDHLMVVSSVDLESVILQSESALIKHSPEGCVSISGEQCGLTAVNETTLCQNINSSFLSTYLASSHDGAQLCSFSLSQYSCTELSSLSAQDLATVLACSLSGNLSVSDEMWKLFTQKINPGLGPALDLFTSTKLIRPHPSTIFLNMIGEVTLSSFSSANLKDDIFVRRWFDTRLRPLLPFASESFLSCLSTRAFSCESYRSVVRSLSQSFDLMSSNTQGNVFIDFIRSFLLQNDTAGCVNGSESSSDWLIGSFGHFSALAVVKDLQTINPSFNVLDTLPLLSVKQLSEISSTPGLLSGSGAVQNLMRYIKDSELTQFYMSLSGALQVPGGFLALPVKDEFLQQLFERANLSSIPDSTLQIWINNILPPFITNSSVQHATTFYSIIQKRSCAITQQGMQLLSSSSSSFQPKVQDQIFHLILGSLSGPAGMRCYGNQSYYVFLSSSFLSFGFPNLTIIMTLMPSDRVDELMASISPAEVNLLMNHADAVEDLAQICRFFTLYPKTPQYLQTEPLLPEGLARQILSCEWPRVLKMQNRSEANRWFDVLLVRYFHLLTSELIAPSAVQNSSCVAFQKLVSVLAGQFNYSSVDFSQRDVYSMILGFLSTPSGSTVKCYNASVPDLNSTAWFVNYLSVFLSYVSLEDLQSFGSITPFIPNPENLYLFGQVDVSEDVLKFYLNLLFNSDPPFNAFYLPQKFLCLAPVGCFLDLNQDQVRNVSARIHQSCGDVLPEVSAALASNMVQFSVEYITALGPSCSGLSTAQIQSVGALVLIDAIAVLSAVPDWNQDQAMTIINLLLQSGRYQMDSAEALQKLGSLIIGVQTMTISSVSGTVWIQAMKSESFLNNTVNAPSILQHAIVNQIISVSNSSDAVLANVPDVMAMEIPRNILLGTSNSSTAVQRINMKKWRHEQAVLVFEAVATEFSNPEDISFQVLQGFTCSRIQSFSSDQVMKLIRGCRRRGNQSITLQEAQLTCMYSYIRSRDLNAFAQFPAEVLIYYNYSLVDRSLCRSYFSSLGAADFSVLSSALSFKKQVLLANAKDCLGISNSSLTRSQIKVLGNMCCFLSPDFIQNSDPYVLEQLKLCSELNQDQIRAAESLLMGGTTPYRSPLSWNITTLQNLGLLPLSLTATFWSKFSQTDKQNFLKSFIRELRKNDRTSEGKILTMMNEVNKVLRVRIRRSAEAMCTSGSIQQPQVYSNMFPFAYDLTQFNACLSVSTLKNNLQAVTDRVYDPSYQRIVLDKLRQAYPDGLPDQVLQVLGSSSHTAMVDDVRSWNITKIDTLAALMNPQYGAWEPSMVQLLVGKYLSVSGNTLGPSELNVLGGAGACALNSSMLRSVSASSLQRASALSLSSCSSEQKSLLFSIALNAFATNSSDALSRSSAVSIPTYQMMQTYLAGADEGFIRRLLTSAVNMDVPTFMSLEQSVINGLNVADVRALLGVNVPDLKTYESSLQIQSWIRSQLQTDLDSLQIGLTGGRNATDTLTTTSATGASVNVTVANPSMSTAASATITATATATDANANASAVVTNPPSVNVTAGKAPQKLTLTPCYLVNMRVLSTLTSWSQSSRQEAKRSFVTPGFRKQRQACSFSAADLASPYPPRCSSTDPGRPSGAVLRTPSTDR
ncbi:hypothetical protein DNTS_030207 [Danionella cerebrum]|uniref:Stereocilin n=1 Tax=Danionella cerebrum TaxID=2873325 RepID=A0A553Q887_9TELE|nr:hypothetical protein DNTS_030207 [Danionella translucida]